LLQLLVEVGLYQLQLGFIATKALRAGIRIHEVGHIAMAPMRQADCDALSNNFSLAGLLGSVRFAKCIVCVFVHVFVRSVAYDGNGALRRPKAAKHDPITSRLVSSRVWQGITAHTSLANIS
jgi:hypothetical protein